ncbi:MAG: hypothetical protein U5N86_02415 [Planctomycetota bacterium]|nr:hypothetical protein [Planctomycetota bacterium]
MVPKGYRCPGCGKAIKDRDIDSDGMHTCKCGEVIFLPTDALSEVPRETSSVASRRFSPVMGIYGAVLVVVLLLSILNCSAINKTQRDFDNQLSSLESSMMAEFRERSQ